MNMKIAIDNIDMESKVFMLIILTRVLEGFEILLLVEFLYQELSSEFLHN